MQFSKNKTIAIAIAIFLTISMSASLMLIPSSSAHNPAWQIPTFAYIVVQPNPIGVGQTLNVYMWLDYVYGEQAGTGGQALAGVNEYRFHNYQLTITAPDGTVSTQLSLSSKTQHPIKVIATLQLRPALTISPLLSQDNNMERTATVPQLQ